jgi:hypothetical protein
MPSILVMSSGDVVCDFDFAASAVAGVVSSLSTGEPVFWLGAAEGDASATTGPALFVGALSISGEVAGLIEGPASPALFPMRSGFRRI